MLWVNLAKHSHIHNQLFSVCSVLSLMKLIRYEKLTRLIGDLEKNIQRGWEFGELEPLYIVNSAALENSLALSRGAGSVYNLWPTTSPFRQRLEQRFSNCGSWTAKSLSSGNWLKVQILESRLRLNQKLWRRRPGICVSRSLLGDFIIPQIWELLVKGNFGIKAQRKWMTKCQNCPVVV